jgi:hypothetical protein
MSVRCAVVVITLFIMSNACTHTTKVKYESPWGRTIEIERNAEYKQGATDDKR